jgi:hypothetical protein
MPSIALFRDMRKDQNQESVFLFCWYCFKVKSVVMSSCILQLTRMADSNQVYVWISRHLLWKRCCNMLVEPIMVLMGSPTQRLGAKSIMSVALKYEAEHFRNGAGIYALENKTISEK